MVTPTVIIGPVKVVKIPRAHPGIPVIVVHIINIHIGAFFNINIHITVFGNVRCEFIVVKASYSFAVLKIFVFFATDQHRIFH